MEEDNGEYECVFTPLIRFYCSLSRASVVLFVPDQVQALGFLHQHHKNHLQFPCRQVQVDGKDVIVCVPSRFSHLNRHILRYLTGGGGGEDAQGSNSRGGGEDDCMADDSQPRAMDEIDGARAASECIQQQESEDAALV